MSDAGYALRTLRGGSKEGAKILMDADPLGPSTEEGRVARDAVRMDPGAALALVNLPSSVTGLSLTGRRHALDTTIGLIGDDATAREMIENYVRADEAVELLRAGGDVFSAAALVAPPKVLLAALFGALVEDLGADTEADLFLERVLVLERWAHNLKDRADYAEILAAEVGSWTVKHLLVAGLAIRYGVPFNEHAGSAPGSAGDIPYGVLVDVGLDTEDLDDLIQEIRGFDIADFDAEDVAAAYAGLARQREQFQEAAPYVAPTVGSDDDL
jgi:hypothetical protein